MIHTIFYAVPDFGDRYVLSFDDRRKLAQISYGELLEKAANDYYWTRPDTDLEWPIQFRLFMDTDPSTKAFTGGEVSALQSTIFCSEVV